MMPEKKFIIVRVPPPPFRPPPSSPSRNPPFCTGNAPDDGFLKPACTKREFRESRARFTSINSQVLQGAHPSQVFRDKRDRKSMIPGETERGENTSEAANLMGLMQRKEMAGETTRTRHKINIVQRRNIKQVISRLPGKIRVRPRRPASHSRAGTLPERGFAAPGPLRMNGYGRRSPAGESRWRGSKSLFPGSLLRICQDGE